MSEKSLTLRCPSCGEQIALQVSRVTKQPASIEDVKGALDEWIEDVDVSEEDDSIVVMPKGFLGKDLWYQINNALKSFDTDWASAGKESRWIIRKSKREE